MKFNHVVCGGTFDHLHLGHKKLLEACLKHGNKVTVGITTRAMVRHKAYLFSLESYVIRAKNVSEFNSSLFLVQLKDIYGPTLTDSSIDAICVTEDTLQGAEQINNMRIKIGMKPLFIIKVPFAYDENNEKISSERIRQGGITREGLNYYTHLISREKYILPDSLKGVLRKPLGRTISSFLKLSSRKIQEVNSLLQKHGYIYHCAVGDMVTLELKKRGVTPVMSIVDGVTQRKALKSELIDFILEKEHYNAKNEKGTIQKNACIALHELFNSGHKEAIKQVVIEGEEDLLTLVAVLLAPLEAHVWYGQQGLGAIDIRVTEKKKQTVYNLLNQFE
jgi:cytidyltransferase-like protein